MNFPLFYPTLKFGGDLICVQNWMGIVSFWVHQLWELSGEKNEKNVFRWVPIFVCFLVNKFGVKIGIKVQIVMSQKDFTLIFTVFICCGFCFIDKPPKMLGKHVFLMSKWSFVFSGNYLLSHFKANKVFFPSIFEGWSIKAGKMPCPSCYFM